jgi:hypothetical protein
VRYRSYPPRTNAKPDLLPVPDHLQTFNVVRLEALYWHRAFPLAPWSLKFVAGARTCPASSLVSAGFLQDRLLRKHHSGRADRINYVSVRQSWAVFSPLTWKKGPSWL